MRKLSVPMMRPWLTYTRPTAQALARRPVAVSKSIATQSWSLVDATFPTSAAQRSGCAALSPTHTRCPRIDRHVGHLETPTSLRHGPRQCKVPAVPIRFSD